MFTEAQELVKMLTIIMRNCEKVSCIKSSYP